MKSDHNLAKVKSYIWPIPNLTVPAGYEAEKEMGSGGADQENQLEGGACQQAHWEGAFHQKEREETNISFQAFWTGVDEERLASQALIEVCS